MRIHEYNNDDNLAFVFDALSLGGFLIDLGSVFALIALPTKQGVDFIDKTKKRLLGKAYGSIVSDPIDFIRSSKLDNASKELLLDSFSSVRITNCFLRIPWKDETNELLINGTHQGLLIDEERHHFFAELNSFVAGINQKELIGGISSVICSSANLSGHPDGTITDLNKAITFGDDNNIDLLIKFKRITEMQTKGSFPIFSIGYQSFRVERNGPGQDGIKSMLIQLGFSELI